MGFSRNLSTNSKMNAEEGARGHFQHFPALATADPLQPRNFTRVGGRTRFSSAISGSRVSARTDRGRGWCFPPPPSPFPPSPVPWPSAGRKHSSAFCPARFAWIRMAFAWLWRGKVKAEGSDGPRPRPVGRPHRTLRACGRGPTGNCLLGVREVTAYETVSGVWNPRPKVVEEGAARALTWHQIPTSYTSYGVRGC